MQNKKIIALIILAVFAVISLIYGLTASPKYKTKNAAIAETQPAIALPQKVAQNVVSTNRRYRRSQFKTWKRNPFVSGIKVSTAPVTKLTLNGIIWDKINPKAMIGDAIVIKGDTIEANKVIDIQQNKVILNDGTKDFELKIEK